MCFLPQSRCRPNCQLVGNRHLYIKHKQLYENILLIAHYIPMSVSPSYPSSIGARDPEGGTCTPSNTSLPFPFRFFLAFETEEFSDGLGGGPGGVAPLFSKERVSG